MRPNARHCDIVLVRDVARNGHAASGRTQQPPRRLVEGRRLTVIGGGRVRNVVDGERRAELRELLSDGSSESSSGACDQRYVTDQSLAARG